ncbi:ferroportin-like [Haliotis asinina]|uniref:ferroportin-like n=1 Tax=Haliotis asinina TaxID=109174 RepID=UPI003531BD17
MSTHHTDSVRLRDGSQENKPDNGFDNPVYDDDDGDDAATSAVIEVVCLNSAPPAGVSASQNVEPLEDTSGIVLGKETDDGVVRSQGLDGADEDGDLNSRKVKKHARSCKDFVTGANFLVYCSHFLSAWGDRMWAFAVGLFLIKISPESLQLTASYGLTSGLSVLLLGALIGDWVDNTPRLKAAQLSLVLQNLFVALCAGIVFLNLTYHEDVIIMWDGWLQKLASAFIILLAVLANLFSVARMIAVERDWVVEICGTDKDMLAKMTATLRRIDLATQILAPIATGQIMYFTEMRIGAVFIGGWNVVTVFPEYYLMWKVYNTVPSLCKKKYWTKNDKAKAASSKETVPVENEANTVDGTEYQTPSKGDNSVHDIPDAVEDDQPKASPENPETSDKSKETEEVPKEVKQEPSSCCGNCLRKMFSSFVILYNGWRTYMTYDVANAGLGLACLYMTVLGFDNITTGYAYSQGISESVLGGFQGGAAVIGILGTLAYPALRRCVGLERTGLFALLAEIACLTMCVVSVWMPGSPFNPYYFFEDHPSSNQTTCSPQAMSANSSLATASFPAASFNSSTSTVPAGIKIPGVTADPMSINPGNNTTPGVPGCVEDTGPESYLSIGLLMAGIITARFGLWVADLTITQLFMERVKEHERGKVNGVQNSINKFMDVLKFILVVVLPQTPVFGYLVIVSFAFICLGFVLYASYSRRSRGHLLPFHKKCITAEEVNQAAAA